MNGLAGDEQMTRRNIRIVCAVTGFLTLCIIFGIYDFEISFAVVHPSWRMLQLLESFGLLAAPFLLLFAGVCVAVCAVKQQHLLHRKRYIAVGIGCAAASAGYCLSITAKASAAAAIVFLAVTAVLVLLLIKYLLHAPAHICERLLHISLIYLLAVVFTLVSVCVLKLCWGRVRFRQLCTPDDFSPWFLPQGVTGFVSFPSGHTANAALLFIVTLFVPYVKHRAAKWACYILPAVWTIVMAVSRVMIGAHYASDVLFGAAISVCSLYLAKRFVEKKRI